MEEDKTTGEVKPGETNLLVKHINGISNVNLINGDYSIYHLLILHQMKCLK